jgi:hypothetical protein
MFVVHIVYSALGLSEGRAEGEGGNSGSRIFGILFPIESEQSLSSFDIREKGYRRVQLPLECIEVDVSLGCRAAQRRASALGARLAEAIGGGGGGDEGGGRGLRVWTYIPTASHSRPPDAEHPILQTYLDVCIRGCLAWGGRALAAEFISSTTGWAAFFLNDAPLSRRPWLHRREHAAVDECLRAQVYYNIM